MIDFPTTNHDPNDEIERRRSVMNRKKESDTMKNPEMHTTDLVTFAGTEMIDMAGSMDGGDADAVTLMPETDIYNGIASAPFDEAARAILSAEVDPAKVRIRPDGLIYLPGVQYRRLLNRAFGAGAWALRPMHVGTIEGDRILVYTGALYVMGRFVSQATGEHHYHPTNGNASYATSLESAKTDCLTRCCKDLGIATELWDADWVEAWKREYAVGVWCENIGRGNREEGRVKRLWRKRDGTPFDYPWKESDPRAARTAGDDPQIFDVDLRDAGVPPIESPNGVVGNGVRGNVDLHATAMRGPVETPETAINWADHIMSFGKHRGMRLSQMPPGYIDWLTENWTPKGMPGDQYIVAAIAARREEKKKGMNDARHLTGGTIPPRAAESRGVAH